ncbi:protein TolA [Bradyrhizobium guangdongense]|uniref:Protein TolA n=1 Tax=Bradyrhizobium guangdongense TaxID=1325090 RepID=A0A410V1J8_9BRAD|nr:protein TolA [Bradyrhizobium guangdongense]QAU37532.1 protein TolA [Bradyrhizobium guangdongense]QOZ58589.1 protein TolA [Bradyrhizobium guangdongense]GGI20137.1 cell envelope integrity/translocation protein TolA [Bradyrhizobium guangdongense]
MKVNVDKTLVASIALHVLVLGWGLLTFSSKAFIAPEESLPIDIISSDQLAQITNGQKTGKKEEPKPKVEKIAEAKPEEDAVGKVTEKKELIKTNSTPDTPPPKPVEKPVEKKPDPPKPVAETKPKEEPKPQEKKPDPAKEDPIAELQKKLETKKPPPKPVEQKVAAVQPQQQPKPKERTFDPAQIARDLDKRAATRHELAGSALNASASLGSTSGTAATNVATWQGAFQGAVKRCFTPTYNGQDANQYEADIDIPMRIDGSLASEPVIVAVRGPSRSIAQAVAESAKRAIVQCQVYSFLPKQQYDSWKVIPMTFGLKDML